MSLLSDLIFDLELKAEDIKYDLEMKVDDVKDFVSNVGEFTTEIGELFIEELPKGAKIIQEGTAAVTETLVDGFKEEVIHGGVYGECSYDKRDRAEKIVKSSKRRLSDRQEYAKAQFEKADKLIGKLSQKEMNVLNEASNNDVSFFISRNKVVFKEMYFPLIESSRFDFGTKIGILGKEIRKSEAEMFLSDANDFSVSVDKAISNINITLVDLKEVTNCIEEEISLLNVFEKAIHDGKMDNSYAITLLKEIMSVDIIDTNNKVSSQYKMKIELLKGELL